RASPARDSSQAAQVVPATVLDLGRAAGRALLCWSYKSRAPQGPVIYRARPACVLNPPIFRFLSHPLLVGLARGHLVCTRSSLDAPRHVVASAFRKPSDGFNSSFLLGRSLRFRFFDLLRFLFFFLVFVFLAVLRMALLFFDIT